MCEREEDGGGVVRGGVLTMMMRKAGFNCGVFCLFCGRFFLLFSAAPGDLTAARRSLRTAGHNTRGGVMKRRKEGALCACSLHRGAPLNAALLLGKELY